MDSNRPIRKWVLPLAAWAIALWLGVKLAPLLLLFFMAFVFAIVLNPLVAGLEKRRLPRIVAALVVCLGVAALVVGLIVLIAPVMNEQATQLWNDIPEYANNLSAVVTGWLESHPELGDAKEVPRLSKVITALPAGLARLFSFSTSLVTVLVLAIVFLTVVVYALVLPEPLVEGLFRMVPARQAAKVERAMTLFSRGIEGWVLSNFIAGAIEGALATVFLSWLGIPGALIWGVLAFFAEFVPKLGLYIMALPPTFVALGLDPMKAVWVIVFYMAMSELVGDTVMPYIRKKTMRLHPVFTVFMALVMAYIFGIWGAFAATPLAALMAAFAEVFWLQEKETDPHWKTRARRLILHEASR